MSDIVDRLRHESEDADKASLGMHKLCSEAADEIERLRDGAQQALDDMGDTGLSVCQATKDMLSRALQSDNTGR